MASDRDEGVIWQGAHWRYPSWHMRVLEHDGLEAAGCKPSDWVDRPLASAIQDLRHERDEAIARAESAERQAASMCRWVELLREYHPTACESGKCGVCRWCRAKKHLDAALGLDANNTPVTPASPGAGGGGEAG